MNLPGSLVRKVQYDYADSKYKEGSYIFASIDEESIETIIHSFLAWAETNDFIEDNKLNISPFVNKE
jgi:hypothetical protein